MQHGQPAQRWLWVPVPEGPADHRPLPQIHLRLPGRHGAGTWHEALCCRWVTTAPTATNASAHWGQHTIKKGLCRGETSLTVILQCDAHEEVQLISLSERCWKTLLCYLGDLDWLKIHLEKEQACFVLLCFFQCWSSSCFAESSFLCSLLFGVFLCNILGVLCLAFNLSVSLFVYCNATFTIASWIVLIFLFCFVFSLTRVSPTKPVTDLAHPVLSLQSHRIRSFVSVPWWTPRFCSLFFSLHK